MENEKWKMKNGKFPGQLQSQTPKSAKPPHAQQRHTDDCHFAAAVFLQLAVGAGVVHRRLDPPIRGSCDRGESARLLQESGVPAGWTIVARQASRLGIWIKQSAKVTPRFPARRSTLMADKMDHVSSPTIMQVIAQLLDRGAVGVVVTVLRGPATGAKLLIDEHNDVTGSLGNSELDALVKTHAEEFLKSHHETRMIAVSDFAPQFPLAGELSLLFERLQPAPRLVVCGAGHVGAALAKLATFLGYQTTLIDDRAEFLERSRFPEEQIELVVTDDWETAVRDAIGNGRGVSVAVVTRGHNE